MDPNTVRRAPARATPIGKDHKEHEGAVEGDRPTDVQHGNPNVDERGRPISDTAVYEDVIGANVDGSEGG